ncbi:MAG: NAD(P)-dependent oxidoreductase [Candidatus Lernaella stagnicola]|nr:NAD(P)-dependent oxidoreductase [Candidatus Lernaella stagnicola]
MLILISDAFDDALPSKLARFGEVTDDKARLPEADIVLVRSATKCRREWIDEATSLKLIIRGGVGMDNIDREYAHSKGIQTTNTAQASAIAVAELTLALMLSIPCNIVPGNESMHERKWLKKQLKRTELYGKTLGLIGLGNIGTEVAKRAKAFGMHVIAQRKTGKPSDHAIVVTRAEELFEKADFISVHVPLTPETENMINAETIAMMKDGVIIINTGRGKTVKEDDLAAALESGKVRAYGTDVYYSDPPAEDCPLYDAPNVVMTPHIGASSKENLARVGDVAVLKIEEFLRS